MSSASQLPSHTPPAGPRPTDLSPSRSSIPSSPFSAFSPSAARRNSRFNTPARASDHDGDIDMSAHADAAAEDPDLGHVPLDSAFSPEPGFPPERSFSQGVKREAVESPARRNPAKPRGPETPRAHSRASSNAETPRTVRPLSRRGSMQADEPQEGSPRTPTAQVSATPNLLADFTQQFEAIARPRPGGGYDGSPLASAHRRVKSSVVSSLRSPNKHPLPPHTPTESRFFNLLDFTPTPHLTPKSVPTITPREVEDIRASYQAQLTALQAQLDGREVELNGLRTSFADSEARCADLSHELKQQTIAIDTERAAWTKVRSELGELFEAEKAEKNALHSILVEKEGVVENLHSEFDAARTEIGMLRDKVRDTEADAKKARDEVLKAREEAAAAAERPGASEGGNAEVERVARELHALYKAKHESKVTALKKSYEGRWEKKVAALTTEVATLRRRHEELQHELDERAAQGEDFTHDISFAPLPARANDEETALLRSELEQLRVALDEEKAEKAELISSVEELLELQASTAPMPQATEDRVRGSMRRVSGISLNKTPTPQASSSSLKSNIEKMGMGMRRERSQEYEE